MTVTGRGSREDEGRERRRGVWGQGGCERSVWEEERKQKQKKQKQKSKRQKKKTKGKKQNKMQTQKRKKKKAEAKQSEKRKQQQKTNVQRPKKMHRPRRFFVVVDQSFKFFK